MSNNQAFDDGGLLDEDVFVQEKLDPGKISVEGEPIKSPSPPPKSVTPTEEEAKVSFLQLYKLRKLV